jgi:S1-C subfamily serine protease
MKAKIFFLIALFTLQTNSVAQITLEITPATIGNQFLVKIIAGGDEFGTGIIIGKKDQKLFIITANHVIENYENSITVELPPNINSTNKNLDLHRDGKVIEKSEEIDLAIIAVDFTEQLFPQYLNIGRTKLYDFDIGEKLNVIGKPQASSSIRITDSKLGSVNYYEDKTSAQIGADFLEGGMSGGVVLNSNMEWVGMATRVNSRQSVGVARMVKIGDILSWMKRLNISHNMLIKNRMIGSWKLTMTAKNNDILQKSLQNEIIEFHEEGTVSGVVEGYFKVTDNSKIIFHNVNNGQSIYVSTKGSNTQSLFQLGVTNYCEYHVASYFNFNSDQNSNSSSMLSLKCYPKRFTGSYSLNFTENL